MWLWSLYLPMRCPPLYSAITNTYTFVLSKLLWPNSVNLNMYFKISTKTPEHFSFTPSESTALAPTVSGSTLITLFDYSSSEVSTDLDQTDLTNLLSYACTTLSLYCFWFCCCLILAYCNQFSSHERPINHKGHHSSRPLLSGVCGILFPVWSLQQTNIQKIWLSSMYGKRSVSSPDPYIWTNSHAHTRHHGRQCNLPPNTSSTSIQTISCCTNHIKHHESPPAVSPKWYIHRLYLQIPYFQHSLYLLQTL